VRASHAHLVNRPPSKKQEIGGRPSAHDPGVGERGLVQVARGGNQAEAELIQGLLRHEGVPSVLRRTAGFDVPDFIAAGPRDVLVAAAHASRARQTLGESDLKPSAGGEPTFRSRPVPLLAGILIVGFAALLLVWALVEAAS
jgi:hypothetical protein